MTKSLKGYSMKRALEMNLRMIGRGNLGESHTGDEQGESTGYCIE